MVADPQPNPRTRVRRSRAWLRFVGLMFSCLIAAVGAYLAAIALAAVVEFEIGGRSIGCFEIFNRWLNPASRVLGPSDRLAVTVTNLAPMGRSPSCLVSTMPDAPAGYPAPFGLRYTGAL